MIPQYVYLMGTLLTTAVVVTVVILTVKRGVKASYRGGSIVIAGSGHSQDSPMGRALSYVQQWVPEIQQVLFSKYLRLMKEAGADQDLLSDYDDARFARALFRYLVSGGNGTQSVQKIVENQIVSGEWKRSTDHVDEYVGTQVWPLVVRTTKDFLNAEYDTTVLQMDGTRRTRWVSNTDLIDTLCGDEVMEKVVEKIVPIFRFAQQCVRDECTDDAR
jgi:hypothetical protein